jgi:TolA-binding protein
MKLLNFVSFILVLTVGWMQFYSAVRETYNGMNELQARVQHLQNQSQETQIELAVEREHFLEFRQNIATMMPAVLKEKGLGEEGYPYRNLASVISRADGGKLRKTIATTLFEAGKRHFRKQEYVKAIRIFRQMIDKYGFSDHIPETYFLLAESHFQENELEECVTVVQQMVELFPSHELTGFSMVRLGRIYEIQNRNDDAIEIYKAVLRSFPQRDVASQAKSSLKGLDL